MDIPIRKATLDDARQLAVLLQAIGWFEAFNSGNTDGSRARVEARLTQCLADQSHSVFIAESPAGEIAGYGSVHWLPYLFMSGPEGYVSELFIRESARGQGVGGKLLKIIEAEARARGCQRLSLINLRSRESYQRQFYIKAGWTERAEAANFVYSMT
ncbi:MAG: GNAT family N-acetyltransferase [Candidatus Binatia bacterium]